MSVPYDTLQTFNWGGLLLVVFAILVFFTVVEFLFRRTITAKLNRLTFYLYDSLRAVSEFDCLDFHINIDQFQSTGSMFLFDAKTQQVISITSRGWLPAWPIQTINVNITPAQDFLREHMNRFCTLEYDAARVLYNTLRHPKDAQGTPHTDKQETPQHGQ